MYIKLYGNRRRALRRRPRGRPAKTPGRTGSARWRGGRSRGKTLQDRCCVLHSTLRRPEARPPPGGERSSLSRDLGGGPPEILLARQRLDLPALNLEQPALRFSKPK